jgi:hypothetical protein
MRSGPAGREVGGTREVNEAIGAGAGDAGKVGEAAVMGIVETTKLMTSVPCGAGGTVTEICLANAEQTAQVPCLF